MHCRFAKVRTGKLIYFITFLCYLRLLHFLNQFIPMAEVKKHKGVPMFAVLFTTAIVVFLIIMFVGGSPADTENSGRGQTVDGTVHTAAFDGCGRVSKYESKSWWQAFLKLASEHLTEYQMLGLNERFEGCMTLDETLFVALVPDGEYFSKDSKIFRYEPAKDRLMALDFNDAVDDKAFNVTAFWRHVDDYINISAEVGDGGGAVKWDGRYYFDRHAVELTRVCTTEFTPEEGGQSNTMCENL